MFEVINIEPTNEVGKVREGSAEIWHVVYTDLETGRPTSVFSYPTREKAELHIKQTFQYYNEKGWNLKKLKKRISLFWGAVQLRNIKIG